MVVRYPYRMATERDLRGAVRTLAVVARHLERASGPLTLPQYRVLVLVSSSPDRASRLAERADVTKATLTGVIDSCVQHGWVERAQVVGDRRGVSLVVTAAGAKVLAEAEGAMTAWLASVLEQAGPTAPEEVASALATFGDGLAAARQAVADMGAAVAVVGR